MRALQNALEREYGSDMLLGTSLDWAASQRRLAIMARMSGGNGFRMPPKEPRRDAQGRTRGQRKRLIRAAAMARVSEDRTPEYMHSAARRRAGYEYDWRSNGYVLRAAA